MRTRKGYWILTGLLAIWLALGGWFDLTRASAMREIMAALHYADYLLLILGPCKLLAVPALLYPKAERLSEWAYAGITFDSLGAFASHCAVHDNASATVAPLIMPGLAGASYALRCKRRAAASNLAPAR